LIPFILCPRNIIGGRGKKLKGGGNTRDFHSRNKIGAKGFSPPRISPRVTSRGQGCEASWGFFVKNESMPAGSRRSRRCALGDALSAMRSRPCALGHALPATRARRRAPGHALPAGAFSCVPLADADRGLGNSRWPAKEMAWGRKICSPPRNSPCVTGREQRREVPWGFLLKNEPIPAEKCAPRQQRPTNLSPLQLTSALPPPLELSFESSYNVPTAPGERA